MIRASIYEAGDPSVFRLENVPEEPVGRGQVRVRVERCGVSYRDVVERKGIYRRDVTFPVVLGIEIAGVVTEIGPDPSFPELVVGAHVAVKAFSSCGRCRLCRGGRESTCFDRKPVRGGYAQSTVLDSDAVVPIPFGIDWDQASWLGAAAGVAVNAVRDTARVRVGETVLVAGASGGVGSASVQVAHLSGARVIALTRSAAKIDTLKADGAAEVVVISSRIDTVSQLRELTNGEGVDVVVDTVGTALFDICFDALAVHGRYALVGELLGGEIKINPARLFFKRAALLGVGSVSRVQLGDAAALAEGGRLRARIAAVLPLDRVVEAHQTIESGAVNGRILLAPNLSEGGVG